ncbi:MAG: DUF951 domain-containing protein [Bacilli bacterium]
MNKQKQYEKGNIVTLKKQHPCGNSDFNIDSLGVDIRLSCTKCNRKLMLPRIDLDKKIKKVIKND